MTSAIEIFNSNGIKYRTVRDNQDDLIVFYIHYEPFEYESDEFEIDSYYLASNKLHGLEKTIIETDKNNGVITRVYDGYYKQIFDRAGVGRIFKNNLLCTSDGSNVVLGILVTNGLDKDYDTILDFVPKCIDCDACLIACPSNAIDGEYERVKCVRNSMDTLDFELNEFAYTGKSILGCNKCRTVCPFNKADYVRPPDIMRDNLKADKFLSDVLNGKKGIAWLTDLIGINYVRPVKMLSLALIAVYNMRYDNCLNYVEKALTHQDERVRRIAKLVLDNYGKN